MVYRSSPFPFSARSAPFLRSISFTTTCSPPATAHRALPVPDTADLDHLPNRLIPHHYLSFWIAAHSHAASGVCGTRLPPCTTYAHSLVCGIGSLSRSLPAPSCAGGRFAFAAVTYTPLRSTWVSAAVGPHWSPACRLRSPRCHAPRFLPCSLTAPPLPRRRASWGVAWRYHYAHALLPPLPAMLLPHRFAVFSYVVMPAV